MGTFAARSAVAGFMTVPGFQNEHRPMNARQQTTGQPARLLSGAPATLVGLSAFGVLLVSIISLRYAYDRSSAIECGICFAIMLTVTAAMNQLRRGAWGGEHLVAVVPSTRVGAILGVLWIAEMALNNIVAPLDPARQRWDNLILGVIALALLVHAVMHSYRANSLSLGIRVGLWVGFVSGLVACCAGLSFVAFGMRFLLADPYSVIEFAERGAAARVPNMATYLAFETMPGAFLHLFILGLGLGGILGLLGGAIGKSLKVSLRHRADAT
jgi:hypothetical protein